MPQPMIQERIEHYSQSKIRRWTARLLTKSLAVVAAATEAVGEKITMEEKFWNRKMETVRRKHNHIVSLFNLRKVLVEKKQRKPLVEKTSQQTTPTAAGAIASTC